MQGPEWKTHVLLELQEQQIRFFYGEPHVSSSSSSKNKKTSGNSAGAGAAIVAVLGIGMFVTFKALKTSAKGLRTVTKHLDNVPEDGIRYFDDVNPNTLKREHNAKTTNPIPAKITETVVDLAKPQRNDDETEIFPEEPAQHELATAGVSIKSNQEGFKHYDWLPGINGEWVKPINQRQRRRQ